MLRRPNMQEIERKFRSGRLVFARRRMGDQKGQWKEINHREWEWQPEPPVCMFTLEGESKQKLSEPFVGNICFCDGNLIDSGFHVDAESGKSFTCEEHLVERDPSEPFMGETVSKHLCGKLPKKHGRTRILDKTMSGEYVLGRPPKKPGGISDLLN